MPEKLINFKVKSLYFCLIRSRLLACNECGSLGFEFIISSIEIFKQGIDGINFVIEVRHITVKSLDITVKSLDFTIDGGDLSIKGSNFSAVTLI